jgi:hypothetical protein
MNSQFWHYLRHDKKKVAGWLQRIDAEMIGSILMFQEQQGISGSCAEIGVHHGKSFIPLCMALRADELAMCIDLFDDQAKNLDSSGRGDYHSFQENLAKFKIESKRIRTFKGSSEDVSPEYLLQQVGPVRFFSVDGGHWKSIVQNDLRLAEACLSEGGVIALDDYCRADWPDVTAGYAIWQQDTESDIIPFATGSNKLYLCRRSFALAYRTSLKTCFLRYFQGKSYRSESGEVDSYRTDLFEQDETTFARALTLNLKIFRPAIFALLKSRMSRTVT